MIKAIVEIHTGEGKSPLKETFPSAASTNKKLVRVESLNLGARQKEDERIRKQNEENDKWINRVKPIIDVKKQLKDFKKAEKFKLMK